MGEIKMSKWDHALAILLQTKRLWPSTPVKQSRLSCLYQPFKASNPSIWLWWVFSNVFKTPSIESNNALIMFPVAQTRNRNIDHQELLQLSRTFLPVNLINIGTQNGGETCTILNPHLVRHLPSKAKSWPMATKFPIQVAFNLCLMTSLIWNIWILPPLARRFWMGLNGFEKNQDYCQIYACTCTLIRFIYSLESSISSKGYWNWNCLSA